MLEPGTVIANNYRVVTRFGAGGFGTVYLGENTTLAQQVVIKVLRDGVRGAGAEEARLLASLDHPNVVHVYAYDERWDCIVMQHLKGRSLQVVLEDDQARLDLISSLRIAAQTALALGAVHERGVVHRDVKPDNVMLDFTAGEVKWVKLIDLGTALRVGRTIENPAGTPEFCGPEQFDGSIGAATGNDIYALGVTLYLLCSHDYPFDGTPNELALQHRDAPVPDLLSAVEARRKAYKLSPMDPQLSFVVEKVGELVESMMAKDPKARPSARQVAFTLTDLVDRFSSQNTQVGRPPEPIPLTQVAKQSKVSTMVLPRLEKPTTDLTIAAGIPPSRSRGPVVAAIALLLLLGAGLAWWSTRARDQQVVVAPDAGSPVVTRVDPVVVPPEPVVVEKDAGDELVALPKVETPIKPAVVAKVDPKKPPPQTYQVTPPEACVFEDVRSFARRTVSEMTDLPEAKSDDVIKLKDQVDDALAQKDCVKTRAAVNALRKRLGAD